MLTRPAAGETSRTAPSAMAPRSVAVAAGRASTRVNPVIATWGAAGASAPPVTVNDTARGRRRSPPAFDPMKGVAVSV